MQSGLGDVGAVALEIKAWARRRVSVRCEGKYSVRGMGEIGTIGDEVRGKPNGLVVWIKRSDRTRQAEWCEDVVEIETEV